MRLVGRSPAVGDHFAAAVLAALDGATTGAVLDVGCGYGRLAYGLQRAGFQPLSAYSLSTRRSTVRGAKSTILPSAK